MKNTSSKGGGKKAYGAYMKSGSGPSKREGYTGGKKSFVMERNAGYGKKPERGKQGRDIEKQQKPAEPERQYAQQVEEAEETVEPGFIMGRNSVREAVRSGRSVDRILVAKGAADGSVMEIIRLAREKNIIVTEVPRSKLDEMCMPFGHGGKTGNHQGVIAMLPERDYATIDDILAKAEASGKPPLVMVLDGVTDTGNFGAILRSCECLGAHGVIIPKRRSATLSPAAAKAAAGAAEYVPVARVNNLGAVLDELKGKGLWAVGAEAGGKNIGGADLTGPLAIVVGAEGTGLSRLVREKCDMLVGIPMAGNIGSLNAAVAASIILYERMRQTQGAEK